MSSTEDVLEPEPDLGEEIEVRILDDEAEQGETLEYDEDEEVSLESDSEVQEEVQEDELDTAARIIESHQKEAQENYDKYVRALADLENVKKRNAKDRADLIRYAGEGLGRDIVDVIDDLERAAAQDESVSSQELLQGLELILKRFKDVLDRHSIVGEDAVSTEFDPNKHEPLATVPSEDHEPGMVIEQFKKAYYFKGKLLRPAQVVVSAERPIAAPEGEEGEE